jgi:ATP-dependent DNA ligase
LPPRPLAGRRRDQLTKATDYGAVLVAIAVAQFYLSGMLQRTLPTGFIAPCLPTKTDKLPSGSQWLHEIKHDGFRIIARKNGAQVRLYSRPGNDLTHRFPLIVETLARLRSRSCIIDGEAVACDDNGIASFNLIRYRRHDDSTFLYAFDLIELNGDDLRRDPIEFNARGGAVPDCPVNTHHSHPGDSPLKIALRSILRSCVWCPDRWSR